jgi:hypothetical protein
VTAFIAVWAASGGHIFPFSRVFMAANFCRVPRQDGGFLPLFVCIRQIFANLY